MARSPFRIYIGEKPFNRIYMREASYCSTTSFNFSLALLSSVFNVCLSTKLDFLAFILNGRLANRSYKYFWRYHGFWDFKKLGTNTETSKKSKMDSETVKRKMISEANIKTSDAYKFILEENNKKIIAGIDFKLEPLTRGLVVSLTNMIPCITLSHWMCLILDPFNKSVCIHLSHNSNF